MILILLSRSSSSSSLLLLLSLLNFEEKIITRKYMIVICLCEMKTSKIKVLNRRKIYYKIVIQPARKVGILSNE